MRKRLILPGVFIVLTIYFAYAREHGKVVCFGKTCVKTEQVSSEQAKQSGLMFRKSLPEDSGMLFVYERERVYSFWMKNMQFPLDIIWLGENMKVAYIVKNAQPCTDICNTLVPDKKARYILEVNAGFVDKRQIKLGDKANF